MLEVCVWTLSRLAPRWCTEAVVIAVLFLKCCRLTFDDLSHLCSWLTCCTCTPLLAPVYLGLLAQPVVSWKCCRRLSLLAFICYTISMQTPRLKSIDWRFHPFEFVVQSMRGWDLCVSVVGESSFAIRAKNQAAATRKRETQLGGMWNECA